MIGSRVVRRRQVGAVLAAMALCTTGQLAVVRPAVADHGGTDFTQTGVGPDGTRWGIYWKWRTGVSATCAADSNGDGWHCTAARPNVVDFAFWAAGGIHDVEQAWAELFSNWSPNPNDHFWRVSGNVDCFSSPNCVYPDNSCSAGIEPPAGRCWRHFEDYEGGWFSGSMGYTYLPRSPLCCGTRWHNTIRYSLTQFPGITTFVPNSPPTVTLVSPNGGSWFGVGPVRQQVFVISAFDSNGHNWTGEVEVYAPNGALVIRDMLGGQRFKSGQPAATVPIAMPAMSGTYTWRARATDTSGTGTATGPWASGSFSYTVL